MTKLSMVVCVFSLLWVSPSWAQVVHVVDDDGEATSVSCEATTTAFTTPSAALAAAGSGDSVLVCPGIYVGTVDFAGKAIVLRSSGGPEVTVLDGNAADSVVKFVTGEGPGSVVEGFTIRNGLAPFDGGGVLIQMASPVVRGNVITGNLACEGPGISVHSGSPVIEGNTITNNRQTGCTGGGGGVRIGGESTALVRRNVITDNFPGQNGGGITLFAAGSPTIELNVIARNSVLGQGGGIWIVNRSNATITGNLIVGNRAAQGGGVYWIVPLDERGPLLVNNTIADNESLVGSGVFADGFDAGAVLSNNIIVATDLQSAVHCGNLNDLNPPVFRSNNVFSATGDEYAGICTDQTGTNGNISTAPGFVDAAAGDYRLLPDSANVDAGDNAAPELAATDLEGSSRVLDGDGNGTATVDIGADELGGPARLLHLSGDLAFGSVPVATTATRTLTITNFGTEDLTVSGIVYPFGFFGPWSGTIPAGGLRAVTVTFSPGLPRIYGGDIIVDANHTSGSNTISASGEGVCRPVMTPVHHMAPPQGSSGNITITSPPVCVWTASAVTDWLVLTGADSGQGNGATTFAAMPNPGETSRTGYIRVGSQLVTVIQAGSASSILWWQHQTTGDLGAWVMDGTTQVAGISYGRVTDMLWKIAATGDFNGDGHTDLVWQHYGSGKLAVWLMNGTTVVSGQPLTPEVVQFLNWKIRAVADFNGDGRSDLVWQHITDGRVALWFMNGSTLLDSMEIFTLDDLGWRIADAADMNGDGKADLVWQHDDTRLATWLMDGSELLSAFLLTPESAAPADWKLRATVDFDGDQKPDLVWQNEADGRIATWLMDGSVMRSAILLTPGVVEDTGWRIVGAKKP